MKRLSLFRKSNSAPDNSQRDDSRFAGRKEMVDWLNGVLESSDPPMSLSLSLPAAGISPNSSPQVSSRRGSKNMISSLLSSPRFLSPLSSRTSAKSSHTSSEETDVSSPRLQTRDVVVKWLSGVLERDFDENRSLDQLRSGLRDENNIFRDRDLMVFCLTNNVASSTGLKRGSKVFSKAFGVAQLPAKSVKSLEESLEHRLGSAAAATTGTKTFLSLWSPEFALSMMKATKSGDWEDLKTVIGQVVQIVGFSGNLAAMIKLQMTMEIETEQEKETARGTLFRGSSLSTYLFSNVYHNGAEGLALLQHVCGPLIKSIFAMKNVLDGSETEKFRSLCSTFMANLDGSIASEILPRSMIDVLQHLHSLICMKFASLNRSVMALFVFVRFFCPAIVSPQMFGLAKDSPSVVQQKNLVLFSKLIVNVGTGVRFDGSKEDRMVQLNAVIESMGVLAEQFFEKVAVFKLSSSISPNSNTRTFGFLRSSSDKNLDLSPGLYSHLIEHMEVLMSDSSISVSDKEKLQILSSLEKPE